MSVVQKAIQSYEHDNNCALLLLEAPPSRLYSMQALKVEDLLKSVRHLSLPADIGNSARTFVREILSEERQWEYGATSLGNYVFQKYLVPETQELSIACGTNNWPVIMKKLMQLSLFYHQDDQVIEDNEFWTEHEEFSQMFQIFSTAWQAVLAQKPEVIGLKSDDELQALRKFAEALFKDMNRTLRSMYDGSWDPRQAPPPRVSLAANPANSKQPQDDDEDDDEDDDDEEDYEYED